jgi:hypothetical protein
MDFKQMIKDWMLPIAMVTGASFYLIYHSVPAFHSAGPVLSALAGVMQPVLIFAMLFLTFCRIEPKDLKPHRWHWWLLLIQSGVFAALGFIAYALIRHLPSGSRDWVVLIESAMLCFICPTATAAAVVTRKLGGDVAGITTYTILVNLVTALMVPLIIPMIRPVEGMDFWMAFSMILGKVFPLLIGQKYRRQNAAAARRRRGDDALHARVALAHFQRLRNHLPDEVAADGLAGGNVFAHLRAVPADHAARRTQRGVVAGLCPADGRVEHVHAGEGILARGAALLAVALDDDLHKVAGFGSGFKRR